MKAKVLLIIFFVPLFVKSQRLSWAHGFGNTSRDQGASITYDNNGNIYTTGYFSGTVDFDPGPGITNLTVPINALIAAYVCKSDPQGNLLWARQFSSPYEAVGTSVSVTSTGDIIVTGHFGGSVDMDPGPGSYIFTSLIPGVIAYNGLFDAFICKLDTAGNFLWAKQFGGTGYMWAYATTIDNTGNIILSGMFKNTIDFNPGPARDTLYYPSPSLFICKLDMNGNYSWAKRFVSLASNGINAIRSMVTDNAGNMYFTGYGDVSGNIIDFGGPVGQEFSSHGYRDAFIVKLTSTGNFGWLRQLGSNQDDYGYSIALDNSGFLYAAGTFGGTIDFDPGPGVSSLSTNDPYYINAHHFITKWDVSGNFQWAKQLKAWTHPDLGNSKVLIDSTGDLYVLGNSNYAVDLDPGPGTYGFPPNNGARTFIDKLSPSGNFIWAREMGGAELSDARMDSLNNIYLTGRFYTADNFSTGLPAAQLLSPAGDWDIFTVKLEEDTCAYLSFTLDSISDISCSQFGYASAHTLHSVAPNNYTWNVMPPLNDSIIQPVASGIYDLNLTDARGCGINGSAYFMGPIYYGSIDLTSHFFSSDFRPGYMAHLELIPINNGCVPVNGSIRLVTDTLLDFDHAIPAPDSISGDTLIWNYTNLYSMHHDSLDTIPTIYFNVHTTAQIGDTIHFISIMDTLSGDVAPFNNTKLFDIPILNGYDPNDMRVYPIGYCIPHYVLNDQLLTYTIRFQNTGNSAALNVFVQDTLDTHFDLSTFRVVASSHPMHVEILPAHVVRFAFDSIRLPDSTYNEPASHGYVIFEVMPQVGLLPGTVLRSQADIYFDYNSPVITNEVYNTVSNGGYGASASTVSIDTCDTYTVGSQIFNVSGNYIIHIPNQYGCDSTINLQLIIRQGTQHAIIASACGMYTLNSQNYLATGIYTQTLLNTQGCDSVITLDLTMLDPDVNVTQSNETLNAIAAGAGYQWMDCAAGTLINGEINQSFTATANGNYAVIVTTNGCSDTSACYAITTVGIKNNLAGLNISIVPNPTNGKIEINVGRSFENLSIEISDITGRIVAKDQKQNTDHFSMEIPGAEGLYFVSITDDKGLKTVVKAVKQ